MKKRVRRILSFILTAVMVFALLPVFGNPIVVKADDVQEHDHSNWEEISTSDQLKKLGINGGNGYLVNNIEISETFTIESGKTVNLCLNGKSIIQTADKDTIFINFGTLNLYDESKKPGKITHASTKTGSGVKIEYHGTFTMNGGTISGNNFTYGGGVFNDGTFTMNGGTISGNEADMGGGVFTDGTFTMNGGTISGNEADIGGGVENNGTFTMKDGTISENKASTGGGVETFGTFTMEGGTISGNEALYGGGVNIYFGTFEMGHGDISNNQAVYGGGGVYINITSEFKMTDGTISENSAYLGGGVYCLDKTFEMKGGSISKNVCDPGLLPSEETVTYSANGGGVYISNGSDTIFKPSGKSVICDNTKKEDYGNTANNVYLGLGCTLKFETDGLDASAKIGITKAEGLDVPFTDGLDLTGTPKGTLENFFSDNKAFKVAEGSNGEASLVRSGYSIVFMPNGGTGTMNNQSRTYNVNASLTANAFTFEGRTFDGWNTAADGSGTPFADGEVTGNLSETDQETITLYAQWTIGTFTISWKNYDGTVLETDKNVAYGSTPTYDGETPIRAKEGNKVYTFSGWTPEIDTVKGAATYTATYSEEVVEQTEPETPQNPTEPETPEEPEEEIPEKDWLDDLRLALNIAAEPDSEKTVEYSGDFALPYEIMNFLVNHPDITFVYHITYEGQEYTITIPAGKAVAYADTPWYGPLWLLANYGGNNAPTGAKGNGTYIVKAGDTLTGISVELGVTIQYLVDKNGIKNPDYIVEGQELIY